MKRFLSTPLLAIVLAMAGYSKAAVAPTQVTGTLLNADGSNFYGTVYISWPDYCIGGSCVSAATQTLYIQNGALSISLLPNDQMLPAGTLYKIVQIAINKPPVVSDLYVPTGTSVGLSNVQSLAVSTGGGGGGSSAFSAITSSSNSTATMVVSGSASLSALDGGTITATSVPVAGVTGLAASATTDTTNATNITSGTLNAARIPTLPYVTPNELYTQDVLKNNASGSSTKTTTTATASAGATSISVTSISTFAAGQGLLIGVSGANPGTTTTQIVAITSASGSTINFSPALISGTSFSSGTNVQHDDSVAAQSTINTVAVAGGVILFPPGYYRMNNCLAQSSNSVLTFPNYQVNPEFTSVNIPVTFMGIGAQTYPIGTSGSIVQTDCINGELLSGFWTGFTKNNFLGYSVSVDNLSFRSYPNPSVTMVDLGFFGQMGHFRGTIDAGTTVPTTYPTNGTPTGVSGGTSNSGPAAAGLVTPHVGNWNFNNIEYLMVDGYYNGLIAGPHTHVISGHLFYNRNAIVLANNDDHEVRIDFADVERFLNLLSPVTNMATLYSGETTTFNHSVSGYLELENDNDSAWGSIASQIDVQDSTNLLYCDITYELTKSHPWAVNGGTNCFASQVGPNGGSSSPIGVKISKGVQTGTIAFGSMAGATSPVMTSTSGTTGTSIATAIAAGASGDCAKWDANGNIGDAGSPCGSGGGGSLPSQTGNSGGALVTNGTTASWGTAITGGPSGAVDCSPADFGGALGICDIVTSIVPRLAAANDFTGYQRLFSPLGMQQLSSATTPAAGFLNVYANSLGHVHTVNSLGVDTNITPTTVLSSSSHVAFGDSITAGFLSNGVSGTTLSLAYDSLLATDEKATLTGYGTSGSYACDMSYLKVAQNALSVVDNNAIYTMMVGTNDANNKGAGSYETGVYKPCHQGAIAWVAVANKFSADAAHCTNTGTWVANTGYTVDGEKSTTNGSTKSCPVTTYGGPIYFWYTSSDTNPGTFTYTVDSGSPVAVSTESTPAIAAQSTLGVMLVRIPVSAGSHTILFTITSATGSSNVASIQAVGTPPAQPTYGSPKVFVGGVPRQQGDANSAATAAYDADALADAALLAGDGLGVYFVPIRNYLCPVQSGGSCYNNAGVLDMNTSGVDSGGLHPNTQGHQDLKQAFEQTMQFTPYPGSGGTPAFSAITSGTNASAAMTVGSGASLAASGSGTIAATSVPVAGVTSLTFTGSTTVAASSTGALTSGDCAKWDASGNVIDAGSPCGSGGGSSAFSALTGSTNTTAAMVVGSGASLTATGTGTIVATSVPASGLPNPAASTLGGVKSLASTSHQWINTISTSGVPASTQPAFTDVSGTATDAQLPTDQCVIYTLSISSATVAALTAVGSGPFTATQTLTFSGLTFTPSSQRICFVEIRPTTAFSGTSITAGTVRLQSNNGMFYSPAQDIFGTLGAYGSSSNNYWSDAGSMMDRNSTSVQLVYTFTGAANTAVSAGALTLDVGFKTVP